MSRAYAEAIIDAIKTYYPDYNMRFMSQSNSGEYYGRGQLEGLAKGLWNVYHHLPMEAKKHVQDSLTGEEWAYFEVWGEP